MHRRDALRSGAAFLCGTSFAGCLDALGSDSAWRDLVIDRPETVYVPSKTDGMTVLGTASAGDRELVLSATRPHRFWTIAGTETNQIAMREAHSMHLMVSIGASDRERYVPADVVVAIDRGGRRVLERTLWPMLSQRMGPHHGDNVALPDPGSYTATIRVVPPSVRRSGSSAKGLEPASYEIEFEYDPAEIEGLDRTILAEERRGRPGAVEAMDRRHAHAGGPPIPTAPPAAAFPDVIAAEVTGDYAVVVATADHEAGRRLIVSPRTPYNGFPLPRSSFSVTIDRDESSESASLIEATHPAFGHHYGAVVDPLEPGSGLTIGVETPPQIARHEGYETAFFDPPELSLRVPR